jgi:hypothetical protein
VQESHEAQGIRATTATPQRRRAPVGPNTPLSHPAVRVLAPLTLLGFWVEDLCRHDACTPHTLTATGEYRCEELAAERRVSTAASTSWVRGDTLVRSLARSSRRLRRTQPPHAQSSGESRSGEYPPSCVQVNSRTHVP